MREAMTKLMYLKIAQEAEVKRYGENQAERHRASETAISETQPCQMTRRRGDAMNAQTCSSSRIERVSVMVSQT